MKTIIIDLAPTLICLLVVIFFYKKLQPKWLQFFLYLLLFTLLVEIGSSLYSQYLKKSNHFIINIYLPVSFVFYFLLFRINLKTKKLKTFINIIILIYLLFCLLDIVFIEGLYFFNIYSFCLGSILIVLCCLLYFTHLFTENMLINYFRLPMFWIATGLMFFYVGNLVQISLLRYIITNNLDPGGHIYQVIMVTLNLVLYGAFIAGFLCNRPWKKEK